MEVHYFPTPSTPPAPSCARSTTCSRPSTTCAREMHRFAELLGDREYSRRLSPPKTLPLVTPKTQNPATQSGGGDSSTLVRTSGTPAYWAGND